MTEDELIARADANYFDSWSLIAAQCPDGQVRRRPGLVLSSSGLPLPFLNVAFVTEPQADPEAAVTEAQAFYAGLRMPWLLRIRAGLDPGFEEAAAHLGLQDAGDVPGMVLHPLTPAPQRAADLRCVRVEGEQDVAVLAAIIVEAFGRAEQLATAFTPALLDASGVEAYAGYVADEPVASALLMRTGDVAGIYGIGTREAWRGRGIGEAITWHAAEQGRRAGCTTASLQASDMGRPVYERMGFRTIAQYRTYLPAPGEGERA
jgi:GNAT superfamily N-acetyltransferase